MEIQVYGPGCKRCTGLMENTEIALRGLDVQVNLTKSTDLAAMMQLGIMTTPALVIDGQIKSTGKLLSPAEIEKILRDHQA